MYFIKTEFYFLLQNTKKIIFNKNTKKNVFFTTEIVKTDLNLDFKYTIPVHIYLTYLGMWKDFFLNMKAISS